ncbi:MAG: methyltransferase domain-containing protein [Ignavibacterium sp.]|jgi:SAM-dependent methyltransferase|nr:methyltransferase domain-containing protein [Ignavibacterium sp.]
MIKLNNYIKKLFLQKSNSYHIIKKLLFEKNGIEIGGPSKLFFKNDIFPIYSIAKNIDNCNFSNTTVWEGKIVEGNTFRFNKKRPPGYQYLQDSTQLTAIKSSEYDFLLSSHVIEHIANPIKALIEWKRILKDDGVLIIVFPHKDGTFDHRRSVTTLNHLKEDFSSNISEYDLTHLDEILELHDLKKDLAAGDFESFKTRSLNNFKNRCLHHHVFDSYLAMNLIDHLKFEILSIEALLPYHIILIAKKSNDFDNKKIFNLFYNGSIFSPFPTDQAKQKKL